MTAMLQPSSVFDDNLFTSAFSYNKSTSSKSPSPIDRQFMPANLYGDSSVWCAPTRGEFQIAPIKPPANQQTNGRKPEKLSLTLPPPIGRPRSQWRPVGELDHPSLPRDQPLSAQSRSHRTDSATLTPSSRSMSDSEYSTAQSESNTILPNIQPTHSKRFNNAQLPRRWDQVGEFQPRSQLPCATVATLPMLCPQRNPSTLAKPQVFDSAHNGPAQTQNYNAFAATQNKFNSRSIFPFGVSDDMKTTQNQIGSSRGSHSFGTAKPSPVSTLSQAVGQQYQLQPTFQTAHTSFDGSRAHNTPPVSTIHADRYAGKLFPPSQDAKLTATIQPKRNLDPSLIAPSVTLNGTNYFDDTQFQDGVYYELPQARGANFGLQSLNYRPFYNNQPHVLYPTQPFNSDCYSVSSGPRDSHRSINARLDSTTPLTYVSADQCLENPHESTHIARSQLLEDFRTNHKTRKFEFRDIYDHIVEFSGDQLGSRFIQHKLENANSDEKDQVFLEIANDARQLMTDVFGNYVIQKLFEHGNQPQKRALANRMRGHMLTLSMQTYGCRVVQKAFEHILTQQQAELVQELDGHILKVVENQNGNHVIQKAIECIPGKYVDFIVQAHRGHVHYLSKHAYGCRVVQRMLEHCEPEAKRLILDELHHDIADLIQDPFGNYVVQHVIVKGELCDRKPVIDKVQVKLVENAMHKFASNVVEKALDYADEEQRSCMLRELIGRDEDGQSLPTKLLNHQFGNYVIQKAAMHLQGPALQSVVEDMQRYLAQLRRVSTGKQVAALEENIRIAQNRLDSHRQHNNMLCAPTQPGRYRTSRR